MAERITDPAIHRTRSAGHSVPSSIPPGDIASTFRTDEFVTVAFDDATEYAHFTDFVYDAYQGSGLSFTDVPLAMSARIAPWLLERAQQERFRLRVLDESDRAQLNQVAGRRHSFDVGSIQDFHVPDRPAS